MRPATICSIFIQADSPGSAGERWESSEMVRLKPEASLVQLKAQQPFLRARYTYHTLIYLSELVHWNTTLGLSSCQLALKRLQEKALA